jgi:hypothetical protein
MPEWVPLNLDLLKNPLNWLVVFFMVVLPLIALGYIHQAWTGQSPAFPTKHTNLSTNGMTS